MKNVVLAMTLLAIPAMAAEPTPLTNAAAIQNNSRELRELFDKVDGLDASGQALNNARPFALKSGKTAVGVGFGYSKGTSAVALSVVDSVDRYWSTSVSVVVTNGSYSETSGGAGVQYQF